MLTDQELLHRYASQDDEPAFGELVRRHVNLVYSAALRQTATRAAAEDVVQQVFTDLARKAGRLPSSVILAAWLHRATRFAAAQQRRGEARRAAREQQLQAMQPRDDEHPEPAWDDVRAWLDESLDELSTEDRDALLLRYFEQRSFTEVGAALGATAEAARKRVERALDRLRGSLARRGVTTTAAALGGALITHAVQVAPAGLAGTLAGSSLAAAAATGAGWLSQFTFLASMKTKSVAAGTVLATVLAVPIVWQESALAGARAEQRLLIHESQSAAGPAPGQQAAPALGDLAQRERDDLARLRRQAPELQVRLDDLNRRIAAAAAQTPPDRPPLPPALATIDFANLRDAGQASPAALLETQLWATLHGDTNRLAQIMAADPSMDPRLLEDQLSELKQEAAKGVDTLLAENPLREIRIVAEQPAELSSDRWMVIEVINRQGNSGGGRKNRLLVRLTDTGWRLVLGLDGQPVGEEVPPVPDP